MLPVPKNISPDPQVKRLSVKNWVNGTVTAFDDGRTPLEGLKASGNVFLQQDGTVRPRPSRVRYGPQPQGKVLGEIFEFKKVTGLTSENWLICMQSFNVSASPSASISPSTSLSPSASASASLSRSISPSASRSPSASQSMSPSSSLSPSASASSSPSASRSPSASVSPSSSISASRSPSASISPSSSQSPSASTSISPSASSSPSSSVSPSPSAPTIGYAQIFIARGEDTTWTACTGKYYDDEATVRYFQIGNKVVIMNGIDSLSYLDIPSSTVIPFVSLTTPAAPTLNTDNTAGSGFPITYRVTWNSTVGETAASNALTVDTAKDRDLWTGTDNVIINLPTIVGSVQSVNIYMGTVSGFEYLIASAIAPATVTFIDDGTFAQDTRRLYPTVNSTAGPKVSRGTVIGGRAFMLGDKDHPYYVWNGGDPGFELDFTPANGGGYSLVGSGTKDVPINVRLHRSGQGNPQIKVLSQGTNGKGKRYTLTPDQVTIGTTIISFYDVTEDEGEDGTDSPDGIIFYDNSIWYPSRDGFKTTGTVPQLQNVLSTNRVSNTIQTDMKNLNNFVMDKCVGLGFEGRLYWSLPVNSIMNNEIWVLDLDRKGAWMKPWSIAADWMWLYNDNSGSTHFLIMSNNTIYDMSYSALTNDDGQAFLTNGQAGQIYFSDDKRMWVQLLQVIIVLLRPQGEINFQVTGKTEDSSLQELGEPMTFLPNSTTTPAGWSEVNKYIVGWGRNAWSKVNLVPSTTNDATQEVTIEIDEEVQWASYAWNTTKVGVDYNISDVIFEYVETGIKDLS